MKDVSNVIDHSSRFVNVFVVLNQNTGHFVHHVSKINNFFLDNSDGIDLLLFLLVKGRLIQDSIFIESLKRFLHFDVAFVHFISESIKCLCVRLLLNVHAQGSHQLTLNGSILMFSFNDMFLNNIVDIFVSFFQILVRIIIRLVFDIFLLIIDLLMLSFDHLQESRFLVKIAIVHESLLIVPSLSLEEFE